MSFVLSASEMKCEYLWWPFVNLKSVNSKLYDYSCSQMLGNNNQ